jgi:integrase
MASISRGPDGKRIIQFVNPNRKRKSIRVGKVSQRTVEEIRLRVEYLNAANGAGCPVDDVTAQWVGKICDALHKKLAKVGLVAPREPRAPQPTCPALGSFLSTYIDSRTHYKPNTTSTIDQARRLLVEHFGEDVPLDSITAADAEDWRNALRSQDYKPATIATHIKRARQMFAYAVSAEMLTRNPFVGLKIPQQVDKSREEFIDQETIQRVLDAAPDSQWRCIIALSRFGGLRCPSEVLALEWQWIDWERERFNVFAPKLEHLAGGGWRTIPLFPELRVILDEAFELAQEGDTHVITRYRAGNVNLRTQFQKIIKRAGVKPWGRLFHNLRSSRQTELTETFPAHVVAGWLGNTVKVATQHYLQTTEEHFRRAAKSAAKSAAHALQNRMQHPSAVVRTESHGELQALVGCADTTGNIGEGEYGQYPRLESNQ